MKERENRMKEEENSRKIKQIGDKDKNSRKK